MLALICGRGALPALIVQNCSRPPLIAALSQFQPDDLVPEVCFRLETLGTFLILLKQRGVTKVCFAGAIRRPNIEPSIIDSATEPLIANISAALTQGDDGALKVVISIFEQAGFQIIGFDEIVPDLFPIGGILTKISPTSQDYKDATRAASVVAGLSHLDVGQACAVAGGQVLAVEAYGGTEWMLNSLTAGIDCCPRGGLLFKSAKTYQDRRIDMPSIAPKTCQQVKDAGLKGIVIARGEVLVLNLVDVISEANRLGLFIWVRESLP